MFHILKVFFSGIIFAWAIKLFASSSVQTLSARNFCPVVLKIAPSFVYRLILSSEMLIEYGKKSGRNCTQIFIA